MTFTIRTFSQVQSQYVAARQVDVYLPSTYVTYGEDRFPVLYMHDGQNIFEDELSYAGISWDVSGAMERLIAEGLTTGAIVVGIWNQPNRWQEYMPQRPLEAAPEVYAKMVQKWGAGEPAADAYLKFLVMELKPLIDTTFRTLSDQQNTLVMGSSMGGLLSLYALCEYPQVFGRAGCVSTHWPAGDGLVLGYLQQWLPEPGQHKIYFDYGTETLDALYEPYQQTADEIMRGRAYEQGHNWVTYKFEGAEHSEKSWRERVHIPLRFMFDID